MQKITFKTRDLKQAAFLGAQLVCNTRFVGLEPLPRENNIYFFVFEVTAKDSEVNVEEELNSLIFQYTNGETCIDPITYDKKMGQLRDHLRNHSMRNVKHG